MNSTSCKCGRIRGELNKTNWTRHLESCGKKKKLQSTSITSFFKLPVKTSLTTTLPLPTRRTGTGHFIFNTYLFSISDFSS